MRFSCRMCGVTQTFCTVCGVPPVVFNWVLEFTSIFQFLLCINMVLTLRMDFIYPSCSFHGLQDGIFLVLHLHTLFISCVVFQCCFPATDSSLARLNSGRFLSAKIERQTETGVDRNVSTLFNITTLIHTRFLHSYGLFTYLSLLYPSYTSH